MAKVRTAEAGMMVPEEKLRPALGVAEVQYVA
jgi:hypothetical protein